MQAHNTSPCVAGFKTIHVLFPAALYLETLFCFPQKTELVAFEDEDECIS